MKKGRENLLEVLGKFYLKFDKSLNKICEILKQILKRLEFFKCDALQEKVTYVGKMNFEFSTKLGSGHPYQHVPKKYKAYCSIEPEKQAYRFSRRITSQLQKS